MDNLEKNKIYTVKIESYSSEAFGVCRIGGRAVFVPKTIVGETWEIKILKVGASAVYAKGEKLLSPSPCRIVSDCPYYGKCGGCDCRHMNYEEELRFKLGKVNDALKHIGRQTLAADEIIPADSVYRYRNKGILAAANFESLPCCGFYRQRSHELISVDDCLIQNELSVRAAKAVCSFMAGNRIPAYDEFSGRGTLRHIFCRKAFYTDDACLCLISARGFGALTGKLVDSIREACPELTGIVLDINKARGNSVLAGDFYTLWGKPDITDYLCGIRYEISPQAFFQVNPPQAEKLYRKALEYADISEDDMVFDLYCGAGTISLCLAKHAGSVIGAEIVPEAVENARKNAEANGIKNAEFICADAGLAAKQLAERRLKPRVVVVDPPRKGMDEAAVEAVASINPERIVYVSCSPDTLARDILRFSGLGYALVKAAAVDMFPRTRHVETVVLMSRVDGK
ncbi:MAG: 23S rRNA (uracil(1939)-C(5))-methyltransferase RlmD [Candidatus Limivicinus sp.]